MSIHFYHGAIMLCLMFAFGILLAVGVPGP